MESGKINDTPRPKYAIKRGDIVNFTDWYKDVMEEDWHEDYVGLYSFCYEVCCQYEEYCRENKITPIWNG